MTTRAARIEASTKVQVMGSIYEGCHATVTAGIAATLLTGSSQYFIRRQCMAREAGRRSDLTAPTSTSADMAQRGCPAVALCIHHPKLVSWDQRLTALSFVHPQR